MKKSLIYWLITLITGISFFSDAQILIKEKILENNFTGNWANKSSTINANDTLVFNMSQAVCTGPYLFLPVSIITDDFIFAVDFRMKYNNSKITFNTAISLKSYLTVGANFSSLDSTLRFSSFSFVVPIQHNTPVATIRFNLLSGPVVASDFNSIAAYLNGDACSFKLIDPAFPATTIAPGGPTVLMNGDSVSLSANANTSCTYLWSTGATTQTVFASITGTYTVTVTSAGGCNATASANVYVMAPLPVQLLDFNVKEVNDEILITWSTANETRNNYFTVNHSANATDWNEIKKVFSEGNSNTVKHYSVKDDYPVSGINYYRLKQTDNNGAEKYFQVKSIYYSMQKNNDLKLILYPNPANEILNIIINENATVQLFDINGEQITTATSLISSHVKQMNVQNLANGIYTLKVYNDNFSETKKVVIEK